MFAAFLLFTRAFAECRPTDPAVAAEDARLIILDGRDLEAYVRAGDAIRALDCADGWLDPTAIGGVLHAGAAAALRRGDTAQADDWLRDALRAAPGVPLNRRLGQDIDARYAVVKSRPTAGAVTSKRLPGTSRPCSIRRSATRAPGASWPVLTSPELSRKGRSGTSPRAWSVPER